MKNRGFFTDCRSLQVKKKKQVKLKEYILYNWTPERDQSGYDYGRDRIKYEYTPFKFEISEKGKNPYLKENEFIKEKYKGELVFLSDMWTLHLIEKVEISDLINPVYFVDKAGSREADLLEILKQTWNLVEEKKPVKVKLSYPFERQIEQIINPLKLIKPGAEEKLIMPFGYIVWQVGKLYGELYKNYEKEVVVYGHSLSDLQLSSLKIYSNNRIEIIVNS